MPTESERQSAGIDTRESVREGLIELRDAMLSIQRFGEAMLLTHAIWHLSDDTGSKS